VVFAAAGLSSGTDDDFCSRFPGDVEGTSSSSGLSFWPPGHTCIYTLPDGRTITTDDGNVTAFWAILAAGLLLVLGRRSKLAFATALVFGVGGLTALYVGFLPIVFVAFWLGASLAWLTTRSLLATAIAYAALVVGWLAQFYDDLPAAWVVVLLIVAVLPQRTEVVT
jgi:hypothetical protein